MLPDSSPDASSDGRGDRLAGIGSEREAGADDGQGEAGLVARGVLAILRAYKLLLSPLFAGSCRFTPSCADYTAEAVRVHGALRGTMLGARRLARCRPFGGQGFDPVPPLAGAVANGCKAGPGSRQKRMH